MGNKKTASTDQTIVGRLKILTKENESLRRGLVERTSRLEETRLATLNLLEDLTSEKDALSRARVREEAMLASMGDGLVLTDQDGKITLANRAFENILGWKGNEVYGKRYSEVVPMLNDKGEEIPEEERPINVVLKERSSAITENNFSYRRKDGKIFPVSITTAPVISGNEFIGAVLLFRDITNEKAIDKAKTEFVSLASHQLRTPLTAIGWYVELLTSSRGGALDEQQKKYVDEIAVGNQRMVVLVNALLNVSRFDLRTVQMDVGPTDIVKVVQEEIDAQRDQIAAKNIKLTFVFDKDIPTLIADKKLLAAVVQNLLSNSAKYTPEKGNIDIALTREADTHKDDVLLRVSDTGYGIPKNQQDKIFTKFFRADNVRAKDTEGTGLGLSIAKSIVDSSGGRIWFESEEGKGTTFYVAFPVGAATTK